MFPRLSSSAINVATVFIISFTVVHIITKLSTEGPDQSPSDISGTEGHGHKRHQQVESDPEEKQPYQKKVEENPFEWNFMELPSKRIDSPEVKDDRNLKQDIGRKRTANKAMFTNAELELSTTCTGVTKPDTDKLKIINLWQEFKLKVNSIFLHRAHFDDRVYLKYTPLIRIYTVVPFRQLKAPIYCYLWYDTEPYLITMKASSVNNLSARKKEFNINQKIYTMQLISCKVFDSRSPSHVSLAISPCEQPDNLLEVSYATHYQKPVHDFAVCTVPQYGRMKDDEVAFFVEWVELNKMFGVGEIIIYNSTHKLSALSQKAYDYYRSEGTLLVEQHQTPVEHYPLNKEYFVSQIGLRSAVNDCILRNMYRYKYITIIDRDEVIVPRSQHTYSDLLTREINIAPALQNASAISVYNAFFYKDYQEDMSVDTDLVSMKYRTHKIPDSPFANTNFIPAKSFINPQRCMSAWNHHCLLPWTGKKFLKPEVALVHHYRSSCQAAGTLQDAKLLGKTRCSNLFNQTVTDNYMLRFRDTLESAVAEKLKEISVL